MDKVRELKVRKERAVLVAAVRNGNRGDNLAELTALAESAGARIVDRFQQRIKSIRAGTYIGQGKCEQLAERVKRFKADVVIFDNDLSPGQIRALEKIVEAKVLDRSELILDIFATRAKTKQAKLQVSLAQLEYTYPRLTRMWSHLDTVAGAGGAGGAGAVGGIGTRGTGEQQLEIDRRLVQKRITELKRQLEAIDRRKQREIGTRKNMFKVCLVGYTNAGKSTLLNRITAADVVVEDRLFATLDTRTKKWSAEGGVEILLSDTVGFVRDLPHQLVASFKATLEEAVNADLLLHVIDVSNPEAAKQVESVEQVLAEIGCGDKPVLQLFNKSDVISSSGQLDFLSTIYSEGICISAKTGLGLEKLAEAVVRRYRGGELRLRVMFSQSDGKVFGFLKAQGRIMAEHYNDGSVVLDVVLGSNQLSELRRIGKGKVEIDVA